MPESQPGLRKSIATARSRMRQQRLIRVAGLSLRVLASLFILSLAAIWLFPQVATGIVALLAVSVMAAFLALAAAWLKPIEENRVVRAVDTRFGLPDHTLSASELKAESGEDW